MAEFPLAARFGAQPKAAELLREFFGSEPFGVRTARKWGNKARSCIEGLLCNTYSGRLSSYSVVITTT